MRPQGEQSYYITSGKEIRQDFGRFPETEPSCSRPASKRSVSPRPCLKNVNMPKQRVFSRYAALIFLAIHQGLLRQIALPSEKFPRRRAHFQFSNKTQWPHCGLFREECYAHCHWNFLLAPPGDRAGAGISVLPHPEAEDLEGPAPSAGGAVCVDRRRGAVEHVDLGGGIPGDTAHFVPRIAGDFPADWVLPGMAAVEVVLEAQGDQRAVDFRRGDSAVCGQRVTLPAAAK